MFLILESANKAIANNGAVSFSEIVKAIAENGFLTAAAAIALFLMVMVFVGGIWLVKRSLTFAFDQLQKEFATIAASHKKMHANMEELLELKKRVGGGTEAPKEAVSKDKKVSEVIKAFRRDVRAGRVDLYSFTNGTLSFNHKKSFLRFVHTFSSVGVGTLTMPLKEALVSLFSDFFEYLFDVREAHVSKFDSQLAIGQLTLEWLKSSVGLESVGLIADGEECIGFVAVAYDEDDVMPNETEYVAKFHDLTVQLSALLGSH
jgi:hypothetical protein